MKFRNRADASVHFAYSVLLCVLAFFAFGNMSAHAAVKQVDATVSFLNANADGNIQIEVPNASSTLIHKFIIDGKYVVPSKTGNTVFGGKTAIFKMTDGLHTVVVEGRNSDTTEALYTTYPLTFFVGTNVSKPKAGIPSGAAATRNNYPFIAKVVSPNRVDLTFNCVVPNRDHTCVIYQDGKAIRNFSVKTEEYGRYTEYSIRNLKEDTSYKFNVVSSAEAGSLPDKPRVDMYTYTPTLTVRTAKDVVTCMSLECRNKDKVAPSVPREFMVKEASSTQITLSWASSTDTSGIKGYNIYRNRKSTPVNKELITAITYTDTGLLPSKEYSYAIEAVDNAGNASREATLKAETAALVISRVSTNPPRVDKVPPTPPKNFTATASGTTGMRLTWTAATDSGSGILGYNIYRNNLETPINSALITDTSYIDKNLLPGKNYTYHIVALDKATVANQSGKVSTVGKTNSTTTGTGPITCQAIGCTNDVIAPTTPTNFRVTNVTPSSVALAWNASTDAGGLKGYYIYRNNATTPINNTVITGTAHNDTGLTANTNYTYSILAVDLADNRSQRATITGKTAVAPTVADTTLPTTPTNFRSTGDTTSSITLAWNASTDAGGIKGYNVYRGAGAIVTTVAALTPNLTVTETGLTASTSYTYKIEAVDNAGNKSTLAVTNAKTDPAPVATTDTTAPTAPSNFRVTGSTTSSISLAWNASTDAGGVRGYNVYRGNIIIARNTTLITGLTFTDTGLTPNTSVTYTVEAIDNAGNKSTRATVTGKSAAGTVAASTTTPPVQPTDTMPPSAAQTFTATADSVSQITLTWGNAVDIGGVKGYNIYRNGATAPLNATPITVLKYVDRGLATSTAYTYAIEAVDNAGNKSVKVSASAKTLAPVDTTVPSAPSSTTVANPKAVSGSGWGVDLSWGAATDNVGVTGYVVKSLAPTASTLTTTTGRTYTYGGLVLTGEYTVSIQAKDARGNLGPARVVKFKLNFAGMGIAPTIQIISNTVDTTAQKVVSKPSATPLVGGSTKEATLSSLMEDLMKLKAQLEKVK